MQRADSQTALARLNLLAAPEARSARKALRFSNLTCASSVYLALALAAPPAAFAAPYVEFDVAPTAECRDVTPPQRIAQYPNQRLIEVTLPVSVRFHGAAMDDVDELAIEINGSSAGMRVHDFAPVTQLMTDIAHDIETTKITNKKRSLDGTLGGTLPIPGADAAAHLTPSITADLSGCETETEKINRLPPKYAVVVSGTSSQGRGVFFKLKRSSQTSLEGVHELAVTFVAPRIWQRSEIQVDCAARGQRKMLWMKQSATIGQTSRMVQLVAMSAKPLRQVVLKPAETDQPVPKAATVGRKAVAATAPQWRPSRQAAASADVAVQLTPEPASKIKTSAAETSATKNAE